MPIHVVPNGVDPVADPPPADPGLRIGSLSRLAPEKNLQLLLDAFDVLSQTRPEATLAIAGGGPEEAALRRHADALGLGSTVSFEGHVDAEDFLRRIDVVAQLSAWENHSYTLLDAVNYGRGVVATSVGGNPEIVGQASLVGAGSSPGVIAARLESQGLDPAARPVRGPGWQTVGGMCDDLATIYAQVAP
nr:glycosyltransferase [Ornithinimicrobium cryptoxanthini]